MYIFAPEGFEPKLLTWVSCAAVAAEAMARRPERQVESFIVFVEDEGCWRWQAPKA